MAQPIRVLISIDSSQTGASDTIVEGLRRAGATVTTVLEEIGAITAICPAETLGELSRVPGVLSVEVERSVTIPSPGSKVQ